MNNILTVAVPGGLSALQWLLAQPASGQRRKAQLDAALRVERAW
jgi:hypothetical protein